jgi:hypothetical protein
MKMNTLIPAILLSTFLLASNSAYAGNKCGSWKAGKLTNLQWWSVTVKGDTRSRQGIRKKVPSHRHATSVGICDADFFLKFGKWWKIIGSFRAIVANGGFTFRFDPSRT